MKRLQLSLLDKIIDHFMDTANEKLKKYIPSKVVTFGNKLIDEMNKNSPSELKLKVDPQYF
jgi:hypothetical protein